jgi:hypothetical protein
VFLFLFCFLFWIFVRLFFAVVVKVATPTVVVKFLPAVWIRHRQVGLVVIASATLWVFSGGCVSGWIWTWWVTGVDLDVHMVVGYWRGFGRQRGCGGHRFLFLVLGGGWSLQMGCRRVWLQEVSKVHSWVSFLRCWWWWVIEAGFGDLVSVFRVWVVGRCGLS